MWFAVDEGIDSGRDFDDGDDAPQILGAEEPASASVCDRCWIDFR